MKTETAPARGFSLGSKAKAEVHLELTLRYLRGG